MRTLPSTDPMDPGYRRLRYLSLGFKEVAPAIPVA